MNRKKQIKCTKCGGIPRISEDEGPFTIECSDCGYGTISWALSSEAWKCWRDINQIEYKKNCGDCGKFVTRDRWVATDHPWKEHPLCWECYSNYDDPAYL